MLDYRTGAWLAPSPERDSGPSDAQLYNASEAADELRAVGLAPELLDVALPFHFALKATKADTTSQED